MLNILFVCEHNSARSQMAEAYLNHFSKGEMIAESAGLEPGTLNPLVVRTMQEDQLDISKKSTKSVFDLFRQGQQYDAVITVCSPELSSKCPLFPGRALRLNWPFDDPAGVAGTEEEKLARIRVIREQIKEKVQLFLRDFNERGYNMFLDAEA